MGLFSWILFGLVVGIIAKALQSEPQPGGWGASIVLGVLGAVVGGWIGNLFGLGPVNSFSIKNIFLAVIGALILLWLYRRMRSR